jgi:ferritin-like metal-binding protein YciE
LRLRTTNGNATGRKHQPRGRQELKAVFEQHMGETGLCGRAVGANIRANRQNIKGKTSDAIIIEAGKEVMKLFADSFPGGAFR